jgi:hypothetical protein
MGTSIVSQAVNTSKPGTPRDEVESERVGERGAALSGRPAFDHRGTTVWEWQTAPGTFSRDASTTRVMRLQSPDLSLEKTAIVKSPEIEEPRLNVAPCGGFNPYDHSPIVKSTPIAAPIPVAMVQPKFPPARPFVLPPPRPTTLLGRLRALFSAE